MKLVTTADGSTTIYVPELDEHYHSTFGAITESRHIFINMGLLSVNKPDIVVFEVGFGSGLNALLTCMEAMQRNLSVLYYGIENFPLDTKLTEGLNYSAMLGEDEAGLFSAIHAAGWNRTVDLCQNFSIHKIQRDITTYKPEFDFDVIYYDAFAPGKQKEVWSAEIFRTLFECLNRGGAIVTYCAQGEVRRKMALAGFEMERLPGPPGKREMLRGWKKNNPPG